MIVDEIFQFLTDQGLSVRWLQERGEDMRAVLVAGALELNVDGAVVIPDVHLGIGIDDSFQERDPTRVARFESFLSALGALKAARGDRFAAVQLGDYFDVMRSLTPAASFNDRLAAILRAYPNVAQLSTALPLLHCIGNHDYELWNNRGQLQALGISAHIARAIGPGVLAFHGNDLASLANIDLDVGYQTWLLSLVQSLITMPIFGPAVDAIQKWVDGSLAADSIFSEVHNTSVPWPPFPPGAVGPPNWTAPWVARDSAAQLGVPLLGWEQFVQQDLTLAIVGHSHRPGISWTEVARGQLLPLVDVGSWTYGRTNFAIVGTDGIGVAELVR